MIPSDHFVFFYNEVFKEIREQGPDALDRYYRRVADRQANFTLDAFRREGLKGMFDYWERIRIEENCQMKPELTDTYYRLLMTKCPSLTKALESDAGPCPVYCDHCPGWVLKVLAMAGYWGVYDIMSRTEVVCDLWVYEDMALAKRKYDELVALRGGTDLVKTNLGVTPPFVANRISDSARLECMHPLFKTAFRFLRETDLASLPVGKVEIDGDNVFAFVSTPELKPFAEQKVEAHRKYIDIHSPIVGEETIGSFVLTEKELALPFNEKDDYVLFPGKSEPITIRKGEFAICFPPYGGHAPSAYLGERPKEFRKICVKIKA